MEIKNDYFIPAIFFILAILSLFSPFKQFFHAFIGQFTTGNSTVKTTLFFFLIASFLTFKNIYPAKKDSKKYIFFLIFGFGLSLLTNFILFSSFDLGVNDYVARISFDVDEWEGTYLQHIHTSKIPIHLVEKFLPFQLPPHDSGRPMYEIMPFADFFAILLIFSWLAFLYYSATFVSSSSNPILASFASSILFIAMGDGGLFSTVSAVGFALLISLYIWNKDWNFKWVLPFVFSAFLISFPNFFLHSHLIFHDWIYPIIFISSIFACHQLFGKKEFYFWLILLSISSFSIVSVSFDSILGKSATSFYAYGLSEINNDEVISLFNIAPNTLTRFGWYAHFNTTKPMNNIKMSEAIYSNTYIYFVLHYPSTKTERKIIIHPISIVENWQQTIPSTPLFNITSIDVNGKVTVTGYSTLNGPELALMFVSMLKSQNIDAIVVSKVV